MLVSCNLLEMLQHWSEDNFVTSFRADKSQAFFYNMIASDITYQFEDPSFFKALDNKL